MKRNYQMLLLLSFLITSIWSCKKDEKQILLEGATAPVLELKTANPNVVLKRVNKDQEFIKLQWTNPDYKFTTGVSSQDVTYTLQIDTLGADFTTPNANKNATAFQKALGASITVGDFNNYLTKLGLEPDMPHEIQIRIIASIGGSAPIPSNIIDLPGVVTYEDFAVPPPTTNQLFLTGDASTSGYSNPLSTAGGANSDSAKQQFTRVNKGLYELTINLVGGGAYKLLQEWNWGTQYHMLAGGTWESGDFEMKDADPGFPGPPSAGTYKITVDFKLGKYTVVKL